MSKFPSQEMDRFNIRLPTGMRDAIAERAKANGRSMNSEIVQILEDALSKSNDHDYHSTVVSNRKISDKVYISYGLGPGERESHRDSVIEKVKEAIAELEALLHKEKNLSSDNKKNI